MWLQLKTKFNDGEKLSQHALGIWIQSFANLPRNLYIDMDIVHNPLTLQFSVDARMHPQLDDGHFDDDEPELV